MNIENLTDAIGYIDDSLIEETQKIREKKRTPASLKKLSLIAACLCLIITGALILYPVFSESSLFFKKADDSSPAFTLGENDTTNQEKDNFRPSDESDGLPGSATGGSEKTNNNTLPPEDTSIAEMENSGGSSQIQNIAGETICAIPMEITVEFIKDDSIAGVITDTRGNEDFEKGQRITIIFAQSYDSAVDINEGDKVYVTYGLSSEENTIIAYEISFEITDNTPALYK